MVRVPGNSALLYPGIVLILHFITLHSQTQINPFRLVRLVSPTRSQHLSNPPRTSPPASCTWIKRDQTNNHPTGRAFRSIIGGTFLHPVRQHAGYYIFPRLIPSQPRSKSLLPDHSLFAFTGGHSSSLHQPMHHPFHPSPLNTRLSQPSSPHPHSPPLPPHHSNPTHSSYFSPSHHSIYISTYSIQSIARLYNPNSHHPSTFSPLPVTPSSSYP